MKSYLLKLNIVFLFLIFLTSSVIAAALDPLPSWHDGATKQRIIKFVESVTDKNNSQYVVPEERIATIDNDGTLWVEQPLYTQFIFAMDQVKKVANQHPEWKTQEPFKSILNNDRQAIASMTNEDIEKIVVATHSGMTVDEFSKTAKDWLDTTKNPHFDRLYSELVYQPMLELMNYLRANDFKIYIVTGGGQEFVRIFSDAVYQVPVEKVIGTTVKTQYQYRNGKPVLVKLPAVQLIDDKLGKPQDIHLFIGKKPLIAIGNSDGDQQMLEWAQSRPNAHFMMLIHHDDAKREFAYGPDSKVGTFSNALMQAAKNNDWTVVSMRNDWKIIFPFEKDNKLSALSVKVGIQKAF